MSMTMQRCLINLVAAGLFLVGMGLVATHGEDNSCPTRAFSAFATTKDAAGQLTSVVRVNESVTFGATHDCTCPITNVTYQWTNSGSTAASYTKSLTTAGNTSDIVTVSIGGFSASAGASAKWVDITGSGGSASFSNDGVAKATPWPDTNAIVKWEKISTTNSNKKIPVDIIGGPSSSNANHYVVKLKKGSGSGQIVVRAKHPELERCYVDLTIAIEGCECDSQTGQDGDNADPYSWISLGRTINGVLAGRLWIAVEEMSPALATPEGLSLDEYGGVDDVVWTPLNGNNLLRQVLAPESLVDIVVSNDFKYGVHFFRRADVAAQDSNGLYQVAGGTDPFVSFIFENPAASTNDVHMWRKTKIVQGLATVTEWEYALEGGLPQWTLRQGNGLRAETLSTVTNATGKIVTRQVKDASQQVASKEREIFQLFDWGLELVSWVVDPDGAALTTTRTYYDDANPGQYGRIASVVYPDGSWERFDYDSEGRETEVVRPWLNAPANTPASSARVTTYSFIPVDPQDDGSVFANSPRVVTEQVLGTIVSRTYHAYYANASQERVEIEEQASLGSAAYGEASNLRTVRVFHPFGPNIESGRVKEMILSDGRQEAYTYENGTWVFAYQPGQSVFTPGAGEYLRTVVTHATVANPNGIANKSTREVRVEDRLGREVMRETHVYTGTGYERIDWTVNELDDFGRVTVAHRANGSKSESVWACCGKESEKDESGIEHVYAYDALKRLVFSKKVGVAAGEYPAQPDQITTYTYDAEGRRLTEVLSAGSLSQSRTNQYDLAGRLIESTDFAGRRTTTAYSQDGLTTTETLPGGLVPPSAGFTRVTERYKDGQVKSVTGTAQIPQYYEYGVNADGTKWTKVYSASNNSPVWVKTTTDLFGRTAKVERPGYSTTEVTENFYNNKDQLVKQSTVHGSQFTVTLFAYDELGNQIRSGLDINGNGSLDLDGIDRITETDTSYELRNGDWYLTTANTLYAVDNSAATITNAITSEKLTGLPVAGVGDPGIVAETLSIDPYGNQTVSRTAIDLNAKKVTRTINVPNSTGDDISITVNGLLVSAQRSTLSTPTLFTYDALGRQTGATDPRLGTSVTHYDSRGWGDYIEDAAGHRTTFTYDPSTGRKTAQTDPLSNTTYYAYTSYGKEEKIWGSAIYPVSYEYDAYNRRVKQHTFRDGAGWSGPTWPATPGDSDETTWTYQEATGLLLSKTDDASKAVSYTYDSANRLATRTWARRVDADLRAAYSYNPSGDLITIDYSDNTPDVAFTYDRLGRQKTAESSVSTHTFAYSGLLLDSETIITSAGTNVIDRSYDSLGRSSGFNLNSDYQVAYGYDTLGRFSSLSSSVESVPSVVNYSYLPNADLISQQSTANGLQSTRAYEDHRNLLTQVKNQVDSETISQFDYVNDAGGRRTLVKNSGTGFQPVGNAFNLYAYNSRSEVISAERFFGTDPQAPGAPVAGQNWDYDYDPIGNRKTAARDGDSEVYTANNLNQYTQRTLSGQVHLDGTAAAEATVTINRPSISGITVEPVMRQGAYFHKKLTLDNSTRADVEEIAVVGVKAGAGTNGTDIVSTYSGVVWAVQSPEHFTYDDDGNQLSDALRRYEWDGENRLIAVTASNVVDGSLTRVEMAYDYMSRRSSKKVYTWDSGSWLLTSGSFFTYDGWNPIKEVCAATGKGSITDYYIWGLDLSGSLQGAGGIGGLLARYRSEQRYYDEQGMLLICHKPPGNPENEQTLRINESAWLAHQAHGDTLGACSGAGVSNSVFLYTFDGNGNVSELLNRQSAIENRQFIVAHYEYSPFGELIVSTGPEAQDNPFRVSTKYFVNEISLGDWGLRWYSPSLGRWLSWDPIGEKAFTLLNEVMLSALRINQLKGANTDWNPLNLLQAFHNDPVGRIDVNGMIDHGSWHSRITDGGTDEQDVIAVWYTASQDEANCCELAKIRRTATSLHIPDGSGPERYLPGDIPAEVDQPGDTRIGHFPYFFPYNLQFNYYLRCTKGAKAACTGEYLSTDQRTFRIDGRNITEVE